MKNRIRVGVLIFQDDKILLVKHVDPKTGFTWWVPPGGGLQEDESVFECGEREVMEETNLRVKLDRLVYVRQFIFKQEGKNMIELFLTSSSFSGRNSTKNLKGLGGDEHFIKELKFFSRSEMKDIVVFPEIIKDEMWTDYKKGFPDTKFLGVTDDSKHGKNA